MPCVWREKLGSCSFHWQLPSLSPPSVTFRSCIWTLFPIWPNPRQVGNLAGKPHRLIRKPRSTHREAHPCWARRQIFGPAAPRSKTISMAMAKTTLGAWGMLDYEFRESHQGLILWVTLGVTIQKKIGEILWFSTFFYMFIFHTMGIPPPEPRWHPKPSAWCVLNGGFHKLDKPMFYALMNYSEIRVIFGFLPKFLRS